MSMTKAKSVLPGLFSVFLFCGSCVPDSIDAEGTLIIGDFDSRTFGEWTMEGTALGGGPSGDKGTHSMLGFLGELG